MKIISSLLAFIYYLLAVMGLPYGSESKIFTPRIDFTVEERTDVFCPSDEVWVNGAEYPTMIQLENGTLLTTFEVFDKGNTEFHIMESTDNGKTWTEISLVVETLTPRLQAAWEPCLFELPEAVGEFEKGTVVLGGFRSMTAVRAKLSFQSGRAETAEKHGAKPLLPTVPAEQVMEYGNRGSCMKTAHCIASIPTTPTLFTVRQSFIKEQLTL